MTMSVLTPRANRSPRESGRQADQPQDSHTHRSAPACDGPDVDGKIIEQADSFLPRSMATKDGAEAGTDGDEMAPRDRQTPSSDGVRLWRDAPIIGRTEMGLWQKRKRVASMSGPGLQISQPPTPKQTPSHKGGVWYGALNV